MNNTIPSVMSAMRIVEMLADKPEGASQSRIAVSAGLSASTCYRILQSLSSHGWVRKNSNGVWQLGLGLLPVSTALQGQAVRIDAMRGVLHEVSDKRGIACKLSIRSGSEQIVAIREEPAVEMQATGSEGVRYPIAEGSSGAALLADMSANDAVALLRAAPQCQTDLRFLRSALASLRKQGWCGRRNIANWPISALSAPIRSTDGTIVASLSFIVPDSRFDDRSLPTLLLETVRKCESKLNNK